jgi:hypothetical protein
MNSSIESVTGVNGYFVILIATQKTTPRFSSLEEWCRKPDGTVMGGLNYKSVAPAWSRTLIEVLLTNQKYFFFEK